MLRKSESPQTPYLYAQLRSKISVQNGSMKSNQNLYESRLQQPRFTQFNLQFTAKYTTQSALTNHEEKNSSSPQPQRHKNSPMYASYIPSRKDQLMITLHLSQGARAIRFPFGPDSTINELTSHLRGISNLQNVIFRSSDLMLDNLLTLDTQKVAVLRDSQPISIRPQLINFQKTPENSLKRFNILKCIGAGGFSKVYLAEVYGVFVALKVIDKKSLLNQDRALIIQNERKVLITIDHPFIDHIHYALQTQNLVVLALEYCCGGELFYHLKKRRKLKQADAKFYFLEIVAALKALHDRGIVYRDLKPENVILDPDGHIRLADFGLAKFMDEDELTHSFCGSAEYMAPEMLTKSGHNFAIDFYCLGALLYELVTGLPPYYSSNYDILYKNILNCPVEFPQEVSLSPQIKSLLSNLLMKDPDRRLGTKGGVAQILSHPWLRGVSIIDILAKKLSPPIKPNLLKNNFDDSEYRSAEYQDMELLRKEKEDGDLTQPHFGNFFFESQGMRRKRQFLQHNGPISMKKKAAPVKNDSPILREAGLLPKVTSAQDLRQLARKTQVQNPNKLQPKTRYVVQPYNKYNTPSTPTSQNGKTEALKYKLPASTKALLKKYQTPGASGTPTPNDKRQYSQQLITQPYLNYSKEHIFQGSYDAVKKPKYEHIKFQKIGTAPTTINNINSNKILESKPTTYRFQHNRQDSPTASAQFIKMPAPTTPSTPKAHSPVISTPANKLSPELRKAYINKDKIRNYLTGIYKN